MLRCLTFDLHSEALLTANLSEFSCKLSFRIFNFYHLIYTVAHKVGIIFYTPVFYTLDHIDQYFCENFDLLRVTHIVVIVLMRR